MRRKLWPFGRRAAAAQDNPPAPIAGVDVLTLWPPREVKELDADPGPADGDAPGKSVAIGTIKYPGGAELGVLVLTSFHREPRGVPAVPIDGRWVTLEIV